MYPNLEAKHTYRDKEGLDSWLEYNKSHRGNALFVDGILVSGEVFINEAVRKPISDKLLKEIADGLHNKPAERIGKQMEVFGGMGWEREGYRDDWERRRFN